MTAEGIAIRNARPADARAIAELERMAGGGVADYVWNSLRADHPGLEILDIGERRFARRNTDVSFENCMIAEIGGRTAGMIHAHVMAGDGAAPPDMDPVLRPYAELESHGSYYISGLAIYPQYRGKGIGTKLLSLADDTARALDCPNLSLIVFEENQGAVRFYRRHGFAETKRRTVVPDDLIDVAGDALLMTRARGDRP